MKEVSEIGSSKYERHSQILEIIKNNIIETQEELAEFLRKNNFDVTQATVSRDIKELHLIKVLTDNGKYRYASINNQDKSISEKFKRVFKEGTISIDYAMNIIIIKTITGMGQGAAASIDSMNLPEVVGSIAGDDTIMVVTRNEDTAKQLVSKFNKLLK